MGAGSFDPLELGLGTGVAFGGAADEVGDDGLGRLFDGLELLGGEPRRAFGLVEGHDAEAGFIGADGGDSKFQYGGIRGGGEGFFEVGHARLHVGRTGATGEGDENRDEEEEAMMMMMMRMAAMAMAMASMMMTMMNTTTMTARMIMITTTLTTTMTMTMTIC